MKTFKIKARKSFLSPVTQDMDICQNDKIYFMGVCGTAMAALASHLKQSGFKVVGSDQNIYYPMSLLLETNKIPVYKYNYNNVQPETKLAIIGNVIERKNPEVKALEDLKIPYISFSEFLEQTVLKDKKNIVVAGTHGKSSTTSLMIQAAKLAGKDPSFFVGALVRDLESSFCETDSDYFIIEGDEYDTAFFAKHPKFYHYKPYALILTSLEFDHGDIYKNIEEIKKVFKNLVKSMPKYAYLLAWQGNKHLNEIQQICKAQFMTYGIDSKSDYQIKNRKVSQQKQSFEVYYKDKKIIFCELSLLGEHNAINALAVIALSHQLNWPLDKVTKGLKAFKGVERRLQKIGDYKQVSLYEDFAHHPTAVKFSLAALKEIFPNRRLIAIFEPRSFTSRLNVFQDDYSRSFDAADVAIISQPFNNSKIDESKRFLSKKLVKDLQNKGKISFYEKDSESIKKQCLSVLKDGDIILVMSNGSFSGLLSHLKNSLEKR